MSQNGTNSCSYSQVRIMTLPSNERQCGSIGPDAGHIFDKDKDQLMANDLFLKPSKCDRSGFKYNLNGTSSKIEDEIKFAETISGRLSIRFVCFESETQRKVVYKGTTGRTEVEGNCEVCWELDKMKRNTRKRFYRWISKTIKYLFSFCFSLISKLFRDVIIREIALIDKKLFNPQIS